jgi:hypothetical protein
VKNRRAFFLAFGAMGVSVALSRRNEPVAALAASAKLPSEAARAAAATMRRFDPQLGEAELAIIARGIDDATLAAASLHPKAKPLRNGEEPVTSFVVPSE